MKFIKEIKPDEDYTHLNPFLVYLNKIQTARNELWNIHWREGRTLTDLALDIGLCRVTVTHFLRGSRPSPYKAELIFSFLEKRRNKDSDKNITL